jgi:hypothetical protein
VSFSALFLFQFSLRAHTHSLHLLSFTLSPFLPPPGTFKKGKLKKTPNIRLVEGQEPDYFKALCRKGRDICCVVDGCKWYVRDA